MVTSQATIEFELHVVLPFHGEVPTGGVPEPLETIVRCFEVLCPSVMGNVLRHRFEMLQLLEVPELQHWRIRDRLELTENHVPSVVKPLQIVAVKLQCLEVIHIVQHLPCSA